MSSPLDSTSNSYKSTNSQGSIGILGAGLLGRLLAVQLVKSGWSVHIFEKDSPQTYSSCGHVGAGMLAPYAELETGDTLVFQLGVDSLALWPNMIDNLATPVFFQQAGSLVVSHPQDVSELQRFQTRIQEKLSHINQEKVGSPFEILMGADIQKLEPSLSRGFAKGLYFPFEGQVDNRQLMEALAQTLHLQNVMWETNTFIEHATPYQVKTSSKNHTFDWVIDCRGLGAAQDIASQQSSSSLNPSRLLRGVRGEIIRIHCPGVHLNRPVRLMHPRYPLYIVPRENHHFIIGATSLETEDFRNVTVQSALELLSACYSLNPGFSEATIEEFSANCRPAFEDNCPQIFHQPGLIQVNGLYRHGFLMAPALILEVEKLLSGSQKDLARYPNLIQANLIQERTHQKPDSKEEFVYGTC